MGEYEEADLSGPVASSSSTAAAVDCTLIVAVAPSSSESESAAATEPGGGDGSRGGASVALVTVAEAELAPDSEAPAVATAAAATATTTTTTTSFFLYRSRWFALVVLSLLILINQEIWINYAPIAALSARYYGVSNTSINGFSVLFLGLYAPGYVLALWAIERHGVRRSLLAAAWVQALGAWVRVAGCDASDGTRAASGGYGLAMLGQALAAIASPALNILPLRLAVDLFPSHQLSLATTVAVVANPVGTAVGQFVPTLLVSASASGSSGGGPSGMPALLIASAMFATVSAGLGLFYPDSSESKSDLKKVARIVVDDALALANEQAKASSSSSSSPSSSSFSSTSPCSSAAVVDVAAVIAASAAAIAGGSMPASASSVLRAPPNAIYALKVRESLAKFVLDLSPSSAAAAAAHGASLAAASSSSASGGAHRPSWKAQLLETFPLLSDCALLLRNWSFMMLFFGYFVGVGIANAFVTLIAQLIQPCGYSADDAGTFGALIIVFGMVGSGLASVLLDRWRQRIESLPHPLGPEALAAVPLSPATIHAQALSTHPSLWHPHQVSVMYRNVLRGFLVAAMAALTLTLLCLRPNQSWLLGASFAVVGFCVLPLLSILVLLASDCAPNVPEDTSAGMLQLGSNVGGIVLISLLSALIDSGPSTYSTVFTPSSLAIFFMLLACVAVIMAGYDFRAKVTSMHGEGEAPATAPATTNTDLEAAAAAGLGTGSDAISANTATQGDLAHFGGDARHFAPPRFTTDDDSSDDHEPAADHQDEYRPVIFHGHRRFDNVTGKQSQAL